MELNPGETFLAELAHGIAASKFDILHHPYSLIKIDRTPLS